MDFFTVLLVDVFAKDSNGGFLGTVGETTDFQSETQICYIDNARNCFIIAENAGELIQNSSDGDKNLVKLADIAVFRTKAEAEKSLSL